MLDVLARQLSLGSLLSEVGATFAGYDLLEHWQQGEFHHDIVLRVGEPKSLPGPVLVVATNCNGGVKEVLCFDAVPERGALWHHRCPDNAAFAGPLPPLLDAVRTVHWFDPCELLRPDARSEYREEFRERAPGGGWVLKPDAASPTCRGPKRD